MYSWETDLSESTLWSGIQQITDFVRQVQTQSRTIDYCGSSSDQENGPYKDLILLYFNKMFYVL